MRAQWIESDEPTGKVYRAAVHARRSLVTGSVRYVPDSGRYKWMASSDVGLQYGWSKSLSGAKRACGRAMQFQVRWLDAMCD